MASVECCKPAPPSEHSSVGVVDTWGAMRVYVNGLPTASKAVLVVTDIIGWEAPLLRKLADKIASAGYLVVVPDYFDGDAFQWIEGGTMQERFQEWIKRHPAIPEPVQISKQIIANLRERGIKTTGVAGFCWGAKVAINLAKEGDTQAAVLLHPSLVTAEDIKEVGVPLSILAAEIDDISPPALIREFEEILISKPEVPYFVKIYPKVHHGWTIRYDSKDEEAVAKAEESHAALLEWFGKFL